MAGDTGLRRTLPSIDALLRSEPGKRASASLGRPLVKHMLSQVLERARSLASDGVAPPADDALLADAARLASQVSTGLSAVINATGVVLHTGLGRAPLPPDAAEAAVRASAYSDLEIDRETGKRGKRSARAELLLTAITGAGAALVVNNCAAALLLGLGALARRKEVLVSRGELVEIGGEFRIPDIMAASGVKLVEVGTTNRTRVGDYRAAASERTGLILKVHPSNYRVVGFTASPPTSELAAFARDVDVPFLYDLGSGMLERVPGVPPDEPSAREALADGADLVTFSGDKLLGGPQAGIVLGREDLIERLRRHPIARAVRVDKMQVAALERVLATYSRGEHLGLPVWRMLLRPAEEIKDRAEELARSLGGELEGADVVRTEATAGGGSVPGYGIPSWGVAVASPSPNAMAGRLRTGRPPVFCRVEEAAVVLDMRTVADEQLPDLRRAILYALEGDDVDGDR
jgi:L-seryl-tRNA(Ser) seleniumtransferase